MNPRTRLVHPGISKNETLADLGLECQFTFAVLPCYVDKKGRTEDRPRRLQVEILPYSKADMNEILQKLADSGFIERYQVDGESYLQIVNWEKYQSPHHKEQKSVIPDIVPLFQAQANVKPTLSQAQAKLGSSSYIDIDTDIEVDIEVEKSKDRADFSWFLELFKKICRDLPQPKDNLSPARLKVVKTRVAEHPEQEYWEKFFRRVAASDFLCGRKSDWKANFDWILKPANIAKIEEGNYDSKTKHGHTTGKDYGPVGVIKV